MPVQSAKTIGIDCRFAGGHGGLARYTRELVTAMVQRSDDIQHVLFVRSTQEDWLQPLRGNCRIVVADIPHYSWEEQWQLPGILRSAHLDLFFSPHFNVPFFCPVPFVMTVHDLILHRFPNTASWITQAAYRILLWRAVRKARAIIAVSTFTATELVQMYGRIARRKTTVITEAVDARFVRASDDAVAALRTTHNLHSPFFLYVGNAKQHKNVLLLLAAFIKAALPDHELILLCSGKEAEQLALPPRVRRITNVADKELPALYSAATALVTASLYEGFCLPVSEAQACGCPVIATNATAITEIASPSALLVEPTVEAFASAFGAPPPAAPSWTPPRWQDAAAATAQLLASVH